MSFLSDNFSVQKPRRYKETKVGTKRGTTIKGVEAIIEVK